MKQVEKGKSVTKSLLARNLSKLRSFNGLNQGALAQALGITRNKIASYESQNIEPKLNLLTKISALFQVFIDDLIGTEINEENYESLKERYLTWHQGFELRGDKSPDKFECTLNRDVIIEFINKNEMIRKMVEGMKAFYDLKNQNSMLSSDSQQLMYILDYLIKTNESIINEFKIVYDKIK